jgi:cell division protein FtsB
MCVLLFVAASCSFALFFGRHSFFARSGKAEAVEEARALLESALSRNAALGAKVAELKSARPVMDLLETEAMRSLPMAKPGFFLVAK